MVSFSCEVCNDTVLKKKLDQHKQRCNGAYYTCIDCSVTFNGTEYRQHTSCISEAEKYEKGLYKGKKKQAAPQSKPQEVKKEDKVESKKEKPVKEESKKKKSSESTDLSEYLKANKQESLYKIVKKISTESKSDKKDILKKLQVTKLDDGSINISF